MSKFIAKDGYFYLSLVFILWLLCLVFGHFSWALLVIFAFLLFIFRQKSLDVACVDEKAILSPIDGKILSIENAEFVGLGECLKILIKNDFFDKGNLNSPFKMQITNISQKHGLFLSSNLRAADFYNEKIIIEAESNDAKIGLEVRAGSLDRKLKLDLKQNTLSAGQKFGFLMNGCVILYLPKNTRLVASASNTLKQGALLGYLA